MDTTTGKTYETLQDALNDGVAPADIVVSKHTYESHAKWPEGCPVATSSDKHHSEDEAEGVCKLLSAEGYGGEGVFFPTETWVQEIKNPCPSENGEDVIKHHIREFFKNTAAVHTIKDGVIVIKTIGGKIFSQDMKNRIQKIGGLDLFCSSVALNGRTAWLKIIVPTEEEAKAKTSRKKKTTRRKKK